MEERLRAIEKKMEVIMFAYEQNNLFLQSDAGTKQIMKEVIDTTKEFIVNTDKRLKRIEARLGL